VFAPAEWALLGGSSASEDFVATRHASAVKAHRQTIKRNEHNRELRSKLRTSLKTIRQAIASGDTTGAKGMLKGTYSIVD
jgi:small subunit ribosomal protein S20